MQLVIYQVMQLQHVHVTNGYGVVEFFTGTTVSQNQLTSFGIAGFFQ